MKAFIIYHCVGYPISYHLRHGQFIDLLMKTGFGLIPLVRISFLETFNRFIILFRLTNSKPLKPVGHFVSGVRVSLQRNVWSLTSINILIPQRKNNRIITTAARETLLRLNWNDDCRVGMDGYRTRLQQDWKHLGPIGFIRMTIVSDTCSSENQTHIRI